VIKSYHSDEQYFIYFLYPFALGGYVGNAMTQHIRKKLRAGEIRNLWAGSWRNSIIVRAACRTTSHMAII
jgi:hypothetical protein